VWLNKQRRNSIFERITEANGDPAEFELRSDSPLTLGGPEPWKLTYTPTGSAFRIVPTRSGGFSTFEVVGDGDEGVATQANWAGVLNGLYPWLVEVRQDAETPDLWSELKQTRSLVAAAPVADAENAPFSAHEQAEVAMRLSEIRTYTASLDLPSEKLDELEGRLQYLEESSARLGRRDWRAAAHGAVLSRVWRPQSRLVLSTMSSCCFSSPWATCSATQTLGCRRAGCHDDRCSRPERRRRLVVS
jgi:hypothetical protein